MKTYRLSVYNRKYRHRELMWERYTSRKKAQEVADKWNALNKDEINKVYVVVEQ